jgi:hypothetical protein
MSFVLVKGAIIQCSHGGQIRLAAGDPRLDVDGSGAATSGMESGLSFASATPPCSNVTTNPAASSAPCVTLPATQGLAEKLAVGGVPVLLASASGETAPSVLPAKPGTWSVANAGQQKLEAV